MACASCAKRKAAQAAAKKAGAQPRTATPARRRINRTEAGARPDKGGASYRPRSYEVYRLDGDEALDPVGTLAEAQKLLRDQGPGWAIRSSR